MIGMWNDYTGETMLLILGAQDAADAQNRYAKEAAREAEQEEFLNCIEVLEAYVYGDGLYHSKKRRSV